VWSVGVGGVEVVIPASSAAWIVAIDSSSSVGSYAWVMPKQPRPSAETVSAASPLPSVRVSTLTVIPLAGGSNLLARDHLTSAVGGAYWRIHRATVAAVSVGRAVVVARAMADPRRVIAELRVQWTNRDILSLCSLCAARPGLNGSIGRDLRKLEGHLLSFDSATRVERLSGLGTHDRRVALWTVGRMRW
jgi:hypothetical protein